MVKNMGLSAAMALDRRRLADKALCPGVGICSAGKKSNMVFLSPNIQQVLDGMPGEGGDSPTPYIDPIEVVEAETIVDSSGKRWARVKIHG